MMPSRRHHSPIQHQRRQQEPLPSPLQQQRQQQHSTGDIHNVSHSFRIVDDDHDGDRRKMHEIENDSNQHQYPLAHFKFQDPLHDDNDSNEGNNDDDDDDNQETMTFVRTTSNFGNSNNSSSTHASPVASSSSSLPCTSIRPGSGPNHQHAGVGVGGVNRSRCAGRNDGFIERRRWYGWSIFSLLDGSNINKNDSQGIHGRRPVTIMRCGLFLVFGAALLVIVCSGVVRHLHHAQESLSPPSTSAIEQEFIPKELDHVAKLLSYACPATSSSSNRSHAAAEASAAANNFAEQERLQAYREQSIHLTHNLTVAQYMMHDTFRNLPFDDWGLSYTEMATAMQPWKQQYVDYVLQQRQDQNASLLIYESASGIGLNLLMTVGVLVQTWAQQQLQHGDDSPLPPIAVYGNDVVEESVHVARAIAAGGYYPAAAGGGIFCTADSTQLSKFVPNDAFDLVLTGYIAPLIDPLGRSSTSIMLLEEQNDAQYPNSTKSTVNNNITKSNLRSKQSSDAPPPLTMDELFELSIQDCETAAATAVDIDDSNSSSTQTATAAATTTSAHEEAQRRQDDWFASWFGEMIRIAKPGAPIVAEHIAYPFCQAMFDWGGVAPEFWKTAPQRYQWDVDPDSLQIQPDALFSKRYHVLMIKKKTK